MQIIFFMVGVSLLIALIFFGAFLWSMQNGQNDDLYTPSIRILLEDETIETPSLPHKTKPL
jgi:cbb3-type cytochrome oxidase maturation protein